MFTWIIFSTQATQPKRDLPRLPFAAIPAPHVPSPVGFFLRFFSFHPFIFRSWSVPFFPNRGQRQFLLCSADVASVRAPSAPSTTSGTIQLHPLRRSDLDPPPCPPPSIHLLHWRRRRRFIRRAPPQRSSALSCFPMFDDFSLCPHDSDGSGAVGLRSSWFPSSGCITGFSHHHNGIQSPGCLPFCFICFARLDMLLIHISVSLEIAVSNQFPSCVHIYKFYLPMIYVRSQRSPSCVQNPIYSEYLLIMLTG